jgi:hypothetical protein
LLLLFEKFTVASNAVSDGFRSQGGLLGIFDAEKGAVETDTSKSGSVTQLLTFLKVEGHDSD